MWQALANLQFGAAGWGDELARGAVVTILLACSALPLGVLGGLGLAFASHSQRSWLSEPAAAFSGIFRGIPELLALLLVYFGGQRVLNIAVDALGLKQAIEFNSYLAGILTLSVVFASYASEVFLGILRTLERSSLDAARSLGIGRWPTFRFILLPELFRLGLPGLSNLWLSIIKQSALVSVIAGAELMRVGYLAATSTREPIFFFGVVCIFYVVLTSTSELLLSRWHRHLSRGRQHG
jgi:polar amino acid transport system permease protein